MEAAQNFLPNQGHTPLAQPSAKPGRVVYNAVLDVREVKGRVNRAGNLPTIYPKRTQRVTIQEHLPCMIHKRRRTNRLPSGVAGTQGQKVHVLADMNGLGIPGDQPHAIVDEHEWGGLADGQAFYEAGDQSNIDFATVFGGLNTTLNTGDEVIHAGDLLYWDVQKAENARPYGSLVGLPNDVILWAIRPYKPDRTDVCVDAIHALLKDNPEKIPAKKRSPLEDAAVMYRRSTAAAGMATVFALLRVGALQLTSIGVQSNGRLTADEEAQAAEWAAFEAPDDPVGNPTHKAAVERLYQMAGAVGEEKNGAGSADAGQVVRLPAGSIGANRGKNGAPVRLDTAIAQTYLARDSAFDVIKHGNKDRNKNTTLAGRIHNAQKNALGLVMAAHNAARHHIVRRIFARAVSYALPGQGVDVVEEV